MTELLRSRKFAAGFVERQNLLLDGEAPRLRAEPAVLLASNNLARSRDAAHEQSGLAV
ncbi:MAG: hypothetical protein H6836_07090 [Planctomycetes bacterium]|nr:hypothetical protein [Planctomycetota bacterium]